jgi:hypothetical protein
LAEGITQEQFAELRQEIEEAKWLAYSTIIVLSGKDRADTALESTRRFIRTQEASKRFDKGWPLYRVVSSPEQFNRLEDADLLTLEEVAAEGQENVSAIKGVGRRTLDRIEAAMTERGLAWAGEVA